MRLVGSLVLVLASMLLSADPAGAQSAAATSPVLTPLDSLMPELEKLYIELHQSPELSLQEEKTSAKMATLLRGLGFEVTEKVGGWGVVGVMKNGAGPTVLVRADMDALPVKEETGLSYASTTTATDDQGREVDVSHVCGHDVHMTVLVGTARILSRSRDAWRGTVVMIGQPAEERGAGARAMLKDGLYTRFPKPDYCIGLHVKADLAAGSIGIIEGYAFANVDSVDITIRGVGGHGAWPHTTKDPIVLAAETILALQTIVSREIAPGEPAVVTVGSIHAGTKHNIIPNEVKLQLTLRSYTDDVRRQTIAAIERITRGLALAAGIPEDRLPIVTIRDEFTPATFNDPELTRRLAGALRSWTNEGDVVPVEPVMGGEDFSEYGRTPEKIPICLLWLGAVDSAMLEASASRGEAPPSLHSSGFAPQPEPTIKAGILALTAAVVELLPPD